MAKHFDVVVLGAGIGALTTAALLARRSWRVLVVGHGHRAPTYTFDGVPLARRPFTFLASSSPAWTRVVAELAQTQTWKRRVAPLDPMFQVLGPRMRLDVPPDAVAFGKEIDRELSAARRSVGELYVALAEANAAADAVFEKDLVFPPGGFWERREAARWTAAMPYFEADPAFDIAPETPTGHPFRAVLETPARFASHASGRLPPFALARLHGAWARGVSVLARGEDELSEFLLERVRAHGGETRLTERVSAVIHKRGHVEGVRIDGDDAVTGVRFVVTDGDSRGLLDLAAEFSPKRATMEALPQLAARTHRFVVSMVVRTLGLPRPLGTEAFLLPTGDGAPPLTVHLHRHAAKSADGTALLVAEALLPITNVPATDAAARGRAREEVLAIVERYIPFLERHYLIVDSPHDGLPLWDYRSGRRVSVDRARTRMGGGSAQAEAMAPQWEVLPPTFFGLGGEPVRMPLGGAFGVGPAILPALGQEGELLSAWAAARLITRTDRRKEKMRREMWSKVELG